MSDFFLRYNLHIILVSGRAMSKLIEECYSYFAACSMIAVKYLTCKHCPILKASREEVDQNVLTGSLAGSGNGLLSTG